MSILKGVGALFGLLLCVAFAIAFLPNVANLANSARTEPATASGLTCTADGSGFCVVTLPTAHMHSDTSGMTVTETAPGSAVLTDETTVGSNREALTIKDLTPAVTYTMTVSYEQVDSQAALATGLPDFLNLAPIIFVMMMLVVGVIVGGAAMSRTFNTR